MGRSEDMLKLAESLVKKNPGLRLGAADSFADKTIGAKYVTGLLPFDILTAGGVRKGGFVEIHGDRDSGKTSMLLTILGNLQKLHPEQGFLYLDAERNLTQVVRDDYPDVNWAKITVLEPNTIEDMFTIIKKFRKLVNHIFIDSVAALSSSISQDKDIEKADMGTNARQFTKGWTEAYTWASYGITCWTLNQERDNMDQYSNEAKVTGGRALKFLKDYEISLRLSDTEKNSLGVEEVEMANAFGGEANTTKKTKLPFAQEVTMTYSKMKNGGMKKDKRIIYLKTRPFCNKEPYKLFSNKPLRFLENYSAYAMAFKTDMILQKGAFVYFMHPFTGEELAKYQGRNAFIYGMEANPEHYFLLLVGTYFYGLNFSGQSTNKMFYNSFVPILNACAMAAFKSYSVHKDEEFFKPELLKKINSFPKEFIKSHPLDSIISKKEFDEFVSRYGKEPWAALYKEVDVLGDDE